MIKKALTKLMYGFLIFVLLFAHMPHAFASEPSSDNNTTNDYQEKIMSRDSNKLELELQGKLSLASDYTVFRIKNGQPQTASYSEVRVGAENVVVTVNTQREIETIKIYGDTPIENIRVGIHNTGFVSLDHDQFQANSSAGLKVSDKKGNESFDIPANENVTIQRNGAKLTVLQGDETIYETENRLYVHSLDEEAKVTVASHQRNYGAPSYRGFFEITASTNDNKLRVLNDVNFEQYLYQVVPSEMPASFGEEALKAQAVAARTYALNNFFSTSHVANGYQVVDSVLSQVYNNVNENEITTRAVDATKGEVMRSNGQLIDARFYSTSSGYSQTKHETWAEGDGTYPSAIVPYLMAETHIYDPETMEPIEFDTSNDEEMEQFFRDLSLRGYGDDSPLHRWKIELTAEELTNTYNSNLATRYHADPKFVLTLDENDEFVSKPIPAEGIGELLSLVVAKRGDGGAATELIIEGTTGTYKLIKEFNIRFTTSLTAAHLGTENATIHLAPGGSEDYSSTRNNLGTLPSSSFVLEHTFTDDNELETITFYGGGFGHGVGMSQYGAGDLGKRLGWSYQEILELYYQDIDLDYIYDAVIEEPPTVPPVEEPVETSFQERIMSKTSSSLELEQQGTLQLASDLQVIRIVKDTEVPATYADARVGAENVTVHINDAGEIFLIEIDGPTPVENMRVGIMNQGFASIDHDIFSVHSEQGLILTDKKGEESLSIPADQEVTFTVSDHTISVESGGQVLYESQERLYVEAHSEQEEAHILQSSEPTLTVTSFTRAQGIPHYRGIFEITASPTGGKLRVINDVNFEEYLFQVLPSEMPEFFGLNALKAQAVAARTYALSDYFSNRFTADGYFVNDSVLSQVYNNSAENSTSTQAVLETSGIVMVDENERLVDARYYSTSSGFGASKHQVWSEADGSFPGVVTPYLISQSHTFDPDNPGQMLEIDTLDEEVLNAFYKDLSYESYDGESWYFRWMVGLSHEELANTINANIFERYDAQKDFILTLDENEEFVSKPIPEEGIGEFVNMYVSERGDGGVAMSLIIEGTTGTYQILKEYNIRFLIRPRSVDTGGETVTLYRAKQGESEYGMPLVDFTILPSGFFSFDIEDDGVTFYGGGYGHGVGMSQFGAYQLGEFNGWEYSSILNTYYPNMTLIHWEDGTVIDVPGDGEPGDGEPGDGEPGDGEPGDGEPGDGEPGDGEPGDGEPGDGEPGDGEPGDGEPGDGEPGDGEPGDGEPGDGEPGDGEPGDDKNNQLPDTATSYYNYLLIGLILLIVSLSVLFLNKRLRKSSV
ncbi:SpoIID/LytB domain-containing protein [Alkalihalobacillus pseudalcaliphilus]|uniref:SpoIID/LytB domain-containing protein n=1 Tax=Alkalihalobacillus pseudalcaliphilus TaxID=79884 RepID=UPI00069E6FAD|nr:SpoIID/LytB domain-containing protein [Alkalihalobacillus pseudalcaliphilus]